MTKLEKLETLIPIYELEGEAQKQIYAALDLEFLEKLVIMPDCHAGYLLPIGGVALLKGVISPSYVGYDIGCGMCCVICKGIKANHILKTNKIKEKIFKKIYETIPIGLGECRRRQLFYPEFESANDSKELEKKVNDKIGIQLGTLGSGNHFIEIGENKDGDLCVTIHSGSRNVGHSIADHYMRLSNLIDKHLPNGFLDFKSEFGLAYYDDMCYALDFALENRKIMMFDVLNVLDLSERFMNNMINETHNHAIVDQKFKILHRKGATPADVNQIGIIPGNMRDGVYVTKGLGNPRFLSSSSHGAGRKLSRTKAKEAIDLDRFKQLMTGIIAKVDKDTLDESPDAYKKTSEVVKIQEGVLIEVIDHIKPLINIKG